MYSSSSLAVGVAMVINDERAVRVRGTYLDIYKVKFHCYGITEAQQTDMAQL
jgi:hypothetical protein